MSCAANDRPHKDRSYCEKKKGESSQTYKKTKSIRQAGRETRMHTDIYPRLFLSLPLTGFL